MSKIVILVGSVRRNGNTYVYAVLSREYIQYPETGMNPEERNHA